MLRELIHSAWLFFLSKFIESIPTHQYPLLCVFRHPLPNFDPSFSRSAYATGALPLLTGADPFSSSSLFSRVSNACWEEQDGSSWGCHWTVTVIVGALILIKIWQNKEWVIRHPPPIFDPSFSRTACATGALPLLIGAEPFSSSSLFSGVSNVCWEEHD